MQIELSSLESSRGQFEHSYEPGELSIPDQRIELAAPAVIAGTIRRDAEKLKIQGKLETTVRVECDRCLKSLALPVAQEFSLEYVTADRYEQLKTAELSEEDLDLSVFDGEVIDVDEIVAEQLDLAVPYQTLCQETCKGLCPTCGVNLNLESCNCHEAEIDPRWAELTKLVNRKS